MSQKVRNTEKELQEQQYEELSREVATEGLKAIRAYLTCQSQGSSLDKWLKDKAKAGAVGVQGYTRFYSAKTNRESVTIAACKAGLLDKSEANLLNA